WAMPRPRRMSSSSACCWSRSSTGSCKSGGCTIHERIPGTTHIRKSAALHRSHHRRLHRPLSVLLDDRHLPEDQQGGLSLPALLDSESVRLEQLQGGVRQGQWPCLLQLGVLRYLDRRAAGT